MSMFVRLLVSLFVSASFLACQLNHADADDKQLVMRSYVVSNGDANDVMAVLDTLFWTGKDTPKLGNARVMPNGQLLVAATPGVQRGVEELLKQLAEGKGLPPPPTVVARYWAVLGKPAKEKKIAPELKPVMSAVEAIAQTQGPMEFTLWDSASLRSVSGQWLVKARSSHLVIEHRISDRGGDLSAVINISHIKGSGGFDTRTNLQRGKFLVLGEAGYSPDDKELQTLFYIVRIDADTN